MIPTTVERVPLNTLQGINDRIRRETEESVARCSEAGKEAIAQRLRELDEEWDVERVLEANASSVSLLGMGLGAFVDTRYFALPALVGGFLLLHAMHGWCPPLPILRRLGFRTQSEIERERYALKAVRGDFDSISQPNSSENASDDRAELAMTAVRRCGSRH